MRKSLLRTLVATVAITAVAALPFVGSARTDRPVLTKDVFVHYPHGFDAKPARPGSGACPDASTCADFKLTRLAWDQTTASGGVHYVIDPAGSGLADTDIATAVANSFNAWNAASLAESDGRSIAFASDGFSAVGDPNTFDALNSVTWADLTSSYPNAIAVTFAWHYQGSREIIQADTIFNNAAGFEWSATGASTAYDLQNIGTHEFGHWLQLGDLYSSRDSELTMYGYGTKGEIKKQTLGLGDTLGVQKLY